MSIHRGAAVVVLVLAGALNLWLLNSSAAGSVLAGITFAALCLSLSWTLSSAREREQLPKRIPPQRSPAGISLAVPSKQPAPAQLVNALTIDLEDYFHTEVASRAVTYQDWERMPSRIESSVQRLLDLLEENNTRATVFVLGWVARKYPALIREVSQRGHEIGCHSYRHRRVNRLTPAIFMEDTRIAKQAIEDATGMVVEGYRAPSFSITPGTEWAFKVLEEAGFSYDSSVHPVWHASYANSQAPRFPYYVGGTGLLEIPISTWRICGFNLPVGGGAYLRLLPYAYIQSGLASVNRREWRPVTVYFHPWEIDYLQPAIHAGWVSHVRQIWGTRTMEAKLRRLLSNLYFAPVNRAYAQNLAAVRPVFTTSAQRAPSLAQVS